MLPQSRRFRWSLEADWLKPYASQIALPPTSCLLLILAGIALLYAASSWGAIISMGALVALWLLSCNAVAVGLSKTLLPAVDVLPPAEALALVTAHRSQAIVILGAGIRASSAEYGAPQLSSQSWERLHYAVRLSKMVTLPLAFAGGTGWAHMELADQSEANVAASECRDYYGISIQWLDAESRDTKENAINIQAHLGVVGIGRIVLVTHAWHMPRAIRAFRAVGFDVLPAPTGYFAAHERPLLEWLPSGHGLMSSRQVLREWLALRFASV